MGYTIPFYGYTTSRFGETAGRSNPHRGHDVAPGGNDFPSWVNGVVVTAGWQSALGNRVVVRNDVDGYYIGVSHLANIKVSVGQRVGIGTALGNIGNTGSASAGRHAHITVSPSSAYPESGAVIDPVQYANQATPNGGSNASTNYGYGLSKDAQLALQQAMAKVNRYGGAQDGVFGPASVKGMQQWLKDMGYLAGDYEVDGEPGPKYGEGLQKLAAAKGGYTGPIDGDPGNATSEALVKWAKGTVINNGGGSSAAYSMGLTEASQKAIQQALKNAGLYTGPVDGVFGPASVAAMQTYLKQVGILAKDYGVDGEPGPIYGAGLQTLAAKHGYTGAVDGVPGDMTSAALVRWAATIKAPTTPTTPPTTPPVTGGKWPTTGTFGIDVASPQRDLDFAKAKADGAKFAIIKAGGLNVTPQYVAPYYINQIGRARTAGLKIGHYYLIGLGQTPEQQAQYFVSHLTDFRVNEDVLALDNEKLDSNGTMWADAAAARFVREVIRLTGIDPQRVWHYAGANDYRTLKPWPELEALRVRYWWAAYGANNGTRDHEPSIQGAIPRVDVHQFSSVVEIAGYKLDGDWAKDAIDVLFAKGTVVSPGNPNPDPDPEPEPEPEPEPSGDAEKLAAAVAAGLATAQAGASAVKLGLAAVDAAVKAYRDGA